MWIWYKFLDSHWNYSSCQENNTTYILTGIGGSRFAALVSNQQPPPNQPNTQYRRFHSIFTSGTWSPLGKRSGIHTTPEESQASSDRANEEEEDIYAEKKSAVFASHGWGAGGSSTPRKQLWTPAANSVRSLMYPQAMSLSEGSWESGRATAGPQRHVSTFQGAGASQQRKPLLHLFVSNGWGPMGRWGACARIPHTIRITKPTLDITNPINKLSSIIQRSLALPHLRDLEHNFMSFLMVHIVFICKI